MYAFEDILCTNGLPETDVAVMRKIFDSLTVSLKDDQEYQSLDSPSKYNSMINNIYSFYASREVLWNLNELFTKLQINDSMKPVFSGYYKKFLEGNIDSILTPDMECVKGYSEFPISSDEVREGLADYCIYFTKVRELLFDQTVKTVDDVGQSSVKRIGEAMSELYSNTRNKKLTDFDDINQECETISKKHNVVKLFDNFNIIITLFDQFPFKYETFVKHVKYVVLDPEIDKVELQRKYLLAILRKDSKYDAYRKYINLVCNEYQQTMADVQKLKDQDERRIRELYDSSN
jgi:hypothetical protein